MIQNMMFNTEVVKPLQMQSNKVQESATPIESLSHFRTYLEDAIQQVSNQEVDASVMSEKLLLGQANVDEVLITAEQALLSLQLTAQVRNKVVEAYQEIMRIQL